MQRKIVFVYLALSVFCLFAGVAAVWAGESIARVYKPTPSYAFCTAVNPIFDASDREPKIYYSAVFYISTGPQPDQVQIA